MKKIKRKHLNYCFFCAKINSLKYHRILGMEKNAIHTDEQKQGTARCRNGSGDNTVAAQHTRRKQTFAAGFFDTGRKSEN